MTNYVRRGVTSRGKMERKWVRVKRESIRGKEFK